jgi:adenylyltransferase/sulfurtransferase
VGEVLRELERRYPTVKGWILDDQGQVRAHVNVFVNGERARGDTAVGDTDVLQVLPSIAGGS